MIERLKKYIENTEKIRGLSTPSLSRIELPGQYEDVLKENFRQIGRLAEENRSILSEVLLPMLDVRRPLDREEIDMMRSVYEGLINGVTMDNLDIPLGYMISGYLWEVASGMEDVSLRLSLCDMHATSCYLMLNYSKRTYPFSDECEKFRKEGSDLCDILLSYLEYDRWIALPDPETRKLVLDLAVYKSVFYEGIACSQEKNAEEIEILRNALRIGADERYRDGLTESQWSLYYQRVREYYGLLLESGNIREFNYPQCLEAFENAERLLRQWETEPEGWKPESACGTDRLCYYRSAYFAGKLSRREYKRSLYELYRGRNEYGFSLDDVFLNLLLPLEYIKSTGIGDLSEEESAVLERMLNSSVNYIFRLPNGGSLVYVIEYMIQLLENFREIPGGMTFEDIGLICLGAFHPPTYIHSKMVAVITRCLCKHLMRTRPELFFDFLGVHDVQEVAKRRDMILDYAYHAALCHDFGKLAIIDTIFVYGRNILDCEFSQIKSHPEMGARMLSKNASTDQYALVAKGHHRWYDDSRGYPEGMETRSLPEKIIIDLVCCADCMDAATDTAGRTYNRGKTLEEFIGEVEEQAGSRYAPFLPELLRGDETRRDLEYLLSNNRNMIYRDTFVMLRKLQRRGET